MRDCFHYSVIALILQSWSRLILSFKVIILVIFAYNDHFSLVEPRFSSGSILCPFLDGGVISYLHGSCYLSKKGPASVSYRSPCVRGRHVIVAFLINTSVSRKVESAQCAFGKRQVWVFDVANWCFPLPGDIRLLLIDIQRFYLSLQCTKEWLFVISGFDAFHVAFMWLCTIQEFCIWHPVLLLARSPWSQSISPRKNLTVKTLWSSVRKSKLRHEEDIKPRDKTFRHPNRKS